MTQGDVEVEKVELYQSVLTHFFVSILNSWEVEFCNGKEDLHNQDYNTVQCYLTLFFLLRDTD